jgi:hypothetical protein
MVEIAEDVFLETDFSGVAVAAIKLRQGLVLVDSPFRVEDQRAWRACLTGLGDGLDRMMVILDAHVDRTLGIRAMESIVVGHANTIEIIHGRSSSYRGQGQATGAECEDYELPSSMRWMTPDITYTESFLIHWDEEPVILSHHPGVHTAATWLQYDAKKLLFVGDSVMLNQPPFLEWSNLGVWIDDLNLLLSDEYKGYTVVSSRNGVVKRKSVEKWMSYLVYLKETIDEIVKKNGRIQELIAEVPGLLKKLNINKSMLSLYKSRLTWGLEAYFQHQCIKTNPGQKE